jgi:hypothetical protein
MPGRSLQDPEHLALYQAIGSGGLRIRHLIRLTTILFSACILRHKCNLNAFITQNHAPHSVHELMGKLAITSQTRPEGFNYVSLQGLFFGQRPVCRQLWTMHVFHSHHRWSKFFISMSCSCADLLKIKINGDAMQFCTVVDTRQPRSAGTARKRMTPGIT